MGVTIMNRATPVQRVSFFKSRRRAMCLFLVSSIWLQLAQTSEASTEGCPRVVQESSHYAQVHQHTCYLFVDREVYWSDARQACWAMGGQMLSVSDAATMDFIRRTLHSRQLRWFKQGVWLGARYISGRWRWTTGQEVTYSDWAAGQPSQLLGLFSVEDCALMRRDDDWKWHDYVCGSLKFHYNYICQFPFNEAGHHQGYSAPQVESNGNTTILTIILATGGVILAILFVLFLIFRSRYNYKRWEGQPSVRFENEAYSSSPGGRQPMLPPPAPHSFRPPPGSGDHLYLTPLQDEPARYEEIGHKGRACQGSPSAGSQTSLLGGCCAGDAPDPPASLGESAESLHSMCGALTISMSSAANDYVDMNAGLAGTEPSSVQPPTPLLEDDLDKLYSSVHKDNAKADLNETD